MLIVIAIGIIVWNLAVLQHYLSHAVTDLTHTDIDMTVHVWLPSFCARNNTTMSVMLQCHRVQQRINTYFVSISVLYGWVDLVFGTVQ